MRWMKEVNKVDEEENQEEEMSWWRYEASTGT